MPVDRAHVAVAHAAITSSHRSPGVVVPAVPYVPQPRLVPQGQDAVEEDGGVVQPAPPENLLCFLKFKMFQRVVLQVFP